MGGGAVGRGARTWEDAVLARRVAEHAPSSQRLYGVPQRMCCHCAHRDHSRIATPRDVYAPSWRLSLVARNFMPSSLLPSTHTHGHVGASGGLLCGGTRVPEEALQSCSWLSFGRHLRAALQLIPGVANRSGRASAKVGATGTRSSLSGSELLRWTGVGGSWASSARSARGPRKQLERRNRSSRPRQQLQRQDRCGQRT